MRGKKREGGKGDERREGRLEAREGRKSPVSHITHELTEGCRVYDRYSRKVFNASPNYSCLCLPSSKVEFNEALKGVGARFAANC